MTTHEDIPAIRNSIIKTNAPTGNSTLRAANFAAFTAASLTIKAALTAIVFISPAFLTAPTAPCAPVLAARNDFAYCFFICRLWSAFLTAPAFLILGFCRKLR